MSNYSHKNKYVIIFYLLLFVISVFLTYNFYNGMIDEENGADGNFSSPLDDTFIHLVYAKNIADGHFFKYNVQDDYTTGNTSILYSFLISVFFYNGYEWFRCNWSFIFPKCITSIFIINIFI